MKQNLDIYPSDNGRTKLEEYVNVSLVDMVTDKIRNNIYSGKYLPGKKLVVRELSEELKVSHTPIKEALNRLVSEGYVVAPPRKSMMVREYSNMEFMNDCEIRMMIEFYCAEEIMEYARKNPFLLECLEKSWQEMERLIDGTEDISYVVWVEDETAFHRSYMKGCGNAKLYELYCQLDSNKQSFLLYVKNNKIPLAADHFKLNNKEHRDIIDAVREGDVQQFRKAVYEHLVRSCAMYVVDEESKTQFEMLKTRAKKFVL
jgi:DNA-binding GntR family transcriptional regulator